MTVGSHVPSIFAGSLGGPRGSERKIAAGSEFRDLPGGKKAKCKIQESPRRDSKAKKRLQEKRATPRVLLSESPLGFGVSSREFRDKTIRA